MGVLWWYQIGFFLGEQEHLERQEVKRKAEIAKARTLRVTYYRLITY